MSAPTEMLAPETLEHIDSLERGFAERAACDIAPDGGPDRGAHVDFDVVLAGGGLSLVYGAYLAQRGYVVFAIGYRLVRDGTKTYPEAVYVFVPASSSFASPSRRCWPTRWVWVRPCR